MLDAHGVLQEKSAGRQYQFDITYLNGESSLITNTLYGKILVNPLYGKVLNNSPYGNTLGYVIINKQLQIPLFIHISKDRRCRA